MVVSIDYSPYYMLHNNRCHAVFATIELLKYFKAHA